MNKDESEKKFLAKIKVELDESTDLLDARTLSRLRQARYRALEETEKKWWAQPRRFRPYFSVAAAMLVLGFAIFFYNAPQQPQLSSSMEDIELLAAGDNLEFFTELDFYTWLAEEMDDAG